MSTKIINKMIYPNNEDKNNEKTSVKKNIYERSLELENNPREIFKKWNECLKKAKKRKK